MSERRKYWMSVLAVLFLGMTFLVSGVGKLLVGSKAFGSITSLAFLPQPLTEVIYIGLPYMEIAIGGLLIFGIAIRFATSLSALLIMGFIASNISAIYLGHGAEPCGGCFGAAGELTAIAALAMDGIMAVMVVVIFVCYQGGFFNICPLALRREVV